MRENNQNDGKLNRRSALKLIGAGSLGVAGFGSLSMSSIAQDEDTVPAPFCGEASLPPQDPPGGQAGQCIGCVEEVCDGPTALEPLFTATQIESRISRVVTYSSDVFDGTCFTIAAEDIPEGAEYLTLKAGQNCFLAEVPADPSGDVTFCLTQMDGQPPRLQDISNATFYACEGENPPMADVVDVTCDSITIETENIPDGEMLDVTVQFADGSSEDYTPTVSGGQATVDLPGDVDPTWVTITYQDNLVLFDDGVMASNAPCGEVPTITDYQVTCKSVVLQTANIPEGATLDVTVIFADSSQETYSPEVGADGVATVDLPGDRDPARVIVVYDSTIIFDQFVEAVDGPCKAKPECPPDLDIAYTYKYGEWWPDTYDDIGDEVDPDVFSIEGDQQEVTICAPFPFAVAYATRKVRSDHKGDWDGKHDDEDGHHKHRKHHKHRDCNCDCFKDCKEQEPVLAEQTDSQFCATISSGGNKCEKKEICWFRVYCPDEDGGD